MLDEVFDGGAGDGVGVMAWWFRINLRSFGDGWVKAPHDMLRSWCDDSY